ncbi:uncharacterized protein BJ212DRAFT_1476061 [Suillus subaureus]|uniref:Uncharacterized protein n=1 Tax=Suillus subaureus TaxID=48587 RepID=A0A9P7ELX2_9AGAM|nr:uncharacterized protein BJ212DRAFT_1476061 [Suillus subaureus]KAG1824776.1 hypothetical protein BJ212DRAFT_1476061 [Suillus subaureus]
MKGSPLSPLTVGSLSVATSPEPEAGAAAVASPQDGPSNSHMKVKPHPITKESKVDEGGKMDVAVKSAVSPSLDNVPVEIVQEDLPLEVMQDDGPVGD